MKLKLICLFIIIAIFGGCASANKREVNDKSDEAAGKLATVEKLQNLIFEKRYDLLCFSIKYRNAVERDLKENREKWLKAWTLNKEQMNLYKQMILRGESNFIFQDGEWKINEY